MNFLRQTILAATPFVVGIALGLLVLPTNSEAAARADFAGISQMGDLECAKVAQRQSPSFFVTAFRLSEARNLAKRQCTPQADVQSAAQLAPPVKFGQVRARFVWGR